MMQNKFVLVVMNNKTLEDCLLLYAVVFPYIVQQLCASVFRSIQVIRFCR